ncbi:MAG: type I-F CRISPR-associated endoribonuclease Cas6/Csy4 [Gammaproteobacteria bacterium]|nr:type I-F CRISPR-associated endoribonuclease Cas6/Csy4 [Gammaproteobacteria bacterium]
MKFYIEATLLPDAEIGLNFLWAKIYQQIHLALVEIQDANKQVPIAVAFPEHDKSTLYLGKKLRLFANEQSQLDALDIRKWLARFSDYVHFTKVREVPASISQYACFSRLQAKSNIERVARRKARRENITEQNALVLLKGFKDEKLKEPFIHLHSLSGGNDFRLFISKREVEQAVTGGFNLYGLSASATVPWF